jgi:hypothetical protein
MAGIDDDVTGLGRQGKTDGEQRNGEHFHGACIAARPGSA